MTKKNIINKSIKNVFIMDESKLTRIVGVINDKYKSLEIVPIVKFDILLSNGKNLSLSELDHVFLQDNTVKNPINIFKIIFNGSTAGGIYNCEIILNKVRSIIDIIIESYDIKWANELFGEVDEQIDRLIVKNAMNTIKREGLFFGFSVISAFLLVFSLAIYFGPKSNINKYFLSEPDMKLLITESQKVKNTEDKINFIYQILNSQLSNLSEKSNTIDSIKSILNIKTFLILLPLLFIYFSFIYLVKYCYPGSIFLWGDYIDYYQGILYRRKFTWNTIILSLIVGIIGNLFVFGISKF